MIRTPDLERLRRGVVALTKASFVLLLVTKLAAMVSPSLRPLMLGVGLVTLVLLFLDVALAAVRIVRSRADDARRAREVRSASDAYREAFARGDADAADEAAERLAAHRRPARASVARARESVGTGERLLLRQRWGEARDVLASIDLEVLDPLQRPGVLNNLAYATAASGAPDAALPLVDQALAAAESTDAYPAERLATIRGTRGIALSLAGRHEEAVAILAPLFETPATPHAMATRGFYLGSSLWALARRDDARRVWRRAASSSGPFATLARQRLDTRPAEAPG